MRETECKTYEGYPPRTFSTREGSAARIYKKTIGFLQNYLIGFWGTIWVPVISEEIWQISSQIDLFRHRAGARKIKIRKKPFTPRNFVAVPVWVHSAEFGLGVLGGVPARPKTSSKPLPHSTPTSSTGRGRPKMKFELTKKFRFPAQVTVWRFWDRVPELQRTTSEHARDAELFLQF